MKKFAVVVALAIVSALGGALFGCASAQFSVIEVIGATGATSAYKVSELKGGEYLVRVTGDEVTEIEFLGTTLAETKKACVNNPESTFADVYDRLSVSSTGNLVYRPLTKSEIQDLNVLWREEQKKALEANKIEESEASFNAFNDSGIQLLYIETADGEDLKAYNIHALIKAVREYGVKNSLQNTPSVNKYQ